MAEMTEGIPRWRRYRTVGEKVSVTNSDSITGKKKQLAKYKAPISRMTNIPMMEIDTGLERWSRAFADFPSTGLTSIGVLSSLKAYINVWRREGVPGALCHVVVYFPALLRK